MDFDLDFQGHMMVRSFLGLKKKILLWSRLTQKHEDWEILWPQKHRSANFSTALCSLNMAFIMVKGLMFVIVQDKSLNVILILELKLKGLPRRISGNIFFYFYLWRMVSAPHWIFLNTYIVTWPFPSERSTKLWSGPTNRLTVRSLHSSLNTSPQSSSHNFENLYLRTAEIQGLNTFCF